MACNLAVTIGKGAVPHDQLVKMLDTPTVQKALQVWAATKDQYARVRAYGEEVYAQWGRMTVAVLPDRSVRVSGYGSIGAQPSQASIDALTNEVTALLALVGQQKTAALVQAALKPLGQVARTERTVDNEGVAQQATRLRISF